MTGITTIVDQLTGAARIPASAAPMTLESKTGPKKTPRRKVSRFDRLISSLGDDWLSVQEWADHAFVSPAFVYARMRELVAAGIAEERSVRWTKGMRREYRRVRG